MVREFGVRHSSLKMMGIAVCLVGTSAVAIEELEVEQALEVAQRRFAGTAASLPDATYFPRSTSKATGAWETVRNTNNVEWVQGFFPGGLWLLYELTGESYWRTRAEAWTRSLDAQKNNKETHDLGFKLFCSYGQAYRLTQDPAYKEVLLTSAESLASRYNAKIGIIDTADWNPDWDTPMVVDTMMNLELLLWAAENGGRPELREMAVSHAQKTIADMVRPDGGTYHVVDYFADTGRIRQRVTYQGVSDDSTWSRGQAWAIYGFTMVYRYTRDPQMLAAAQQTADYYLDRLPLDFVPNWDFQAAQQMKDSSAAAAVASALLELETFVEGEKKTRYRQAALRTLKSLSSPTYLASNARTDGVLLHAVGHLPANKQVDVSLIYGDYYFLEALMRLTPKPTPAWYSRTDVEAGLRTVPSENTGIQETAFELTPLRNGGGEIGYADASTQLAGVGETAVRLRWIPGGVFEAVNGAAYSAANSVTPMPEVTYQVRMRADLTARTYSLWIAPPGGGEVQVAQDFAFAQSAPPSDDLGRMLLKAGERDGDFKVDRHRANGALGEQDPSLPPESSPLPLPGSEGAESPEASGGCSAAGGPLSTWMIAGLLIPGLAARRRRRG
ncbi:MAG TPA: glycoside hydrolase family 88 protein [Myxococcaceae bacterium]|nr:glycoside hydrolase family 88 protein [Myxococcaceae bacterium]